jgi:hypothetical protein
MVAAMTSAQRQRAPIVHTTADVQTSVNTASLRPPLAPRDPFRLNVGARSDNHHQQRRSLNHELHKQFEVDVEAIGLCYEIMSCMLKLS